MYLPYISLSLVFLAVIEVEEAFTELGRSAEIVHYNPSDFHWSEDKKNCTPDTAIIDKLLNGTGYNKYRIPRKLEFYKT